MEQMQNKKPLQDNELINYIGIEIEALRKEGYNPSQIRNLISAQLIECVMRTIAIKQDGEYDYYAFKPLFIALKFLIDIELKQKEEYNYLPEVSKDITKLAEVSEYLDHRIRVITESE